MISFPNAKINLGLNIRGKRTDGYHDIETCFYPVKWNDILEIVPSAKTTISLSGRKILGKPEENLCFKAYQLLKDDYELPPVTIYLHKVIPMGAGLGGGSSDAAFTLKLLNELFLIGLTQVQLSYYAGLLGSDVTFFLKNSVAIGTGKGNILEDCSLSLENYYLVLVFPEIHCSTISAYKKIKTDPNYNLKRNLVKPILEWENCIINTFEDCIFSTFPEIKKIKDTLYDKGAVFSSLSGSGSTVFGIFEKEPDNIKSSFPKNYEVNIQKGR